MASSADPEPATPGATWRLLLAVLARLPQGLLSRGAGALADIPLPRLVRRPVLGLFARLTGIDVEEAEKPLVEYRSVNAFFVRRLAPGARTWPTDDHVVASPVDGIVGARGPIDGTTLVQAKGRLYTAGALLGDASDAATFRDGSFVTLYLSPRHYHRIHAPVTGRVVSARYVPGGLLPVNVPAVSHIPDLFVRNERLVARLETPTGPVALVAVGAYNVGRISAAFDPAWGGATGDAAITNRRSPPPTERRYQPAISVRVGSDFMAFHLGSTVVLLLGREFDLTPAPTSGRDLRAGTVLARPALGGHLAEPPSDGSAGP